MAYIVGFQRTEEDESKMTRSHLWTTCLLVAVTVASSLGTVAGGVKKGSDDIIGVDEISAGMKGHGLTVFSGAEVERFDVEVISVLSDFLPDQDLILARCSHTVLSHTGVIAGMSGSPVYLDGRLAGAVAYAWRFSKDPIAGITPAADMEAYLHMPAMPEDVGIGGPGLFGPPGGVAGNKPGTGGGFFDRFDPQGSQLVPLATPVSGGGPLWSSFIRHMAPVLDSHFMVDVPPVPAGTSPSAGPAGGQGAAAKGSGGGTAAGKGFRPGDPIAVRLVGGDLDMAATGTVTLVEGRRALGFGHPMFNWGAVRFPAARAYIHHCLASEAFSFKMSESLEPMGAVVHDRQAGIVADTQMDPSTVDLDVDLHDTTRDLTQRWHMDVAHHPQVTPGLIRSALTSAVDRFALEVVDTLAHGRYAITVQGHETLEFEDKVFLSTGTLSLAYSKRLYDAINAILHTSFENARLERVAVDLDLSYGHPVATIDGAWAAKEEVEEGELVKVWIVIDPNQGSKMTLGFTLEVPPGTAGQTLRVDIKPGSRVPPEIVPPQDLDDVIANLEKGWQDDVAVAVVNAPTGGLTIEGHHVPLLPLSALSTLKPEVGDLGQVPLAGLDRYLVTTPYLLKGAVSLKIKVKDN
jgi:hypothetical protein